MAKFKVGDRVRCLRDHDPGRQFTAGKEYTVTRTNLYSVGMNDDRGRDNGWGEEHFELANPSPIRTVTRREIVPGVSGILQWYEDGSVLVAPCTPTPDELREAARIFNDIADVLDENAKEAE